MCPDFLGSQYLTSAKVLQGPVAGRWSLTLEGGGVRKGALKPPSPPPPLCERSLVPASITYLSTCTMVCIA